MASNRATPYHAGSVNPKKRLRDGRVKRSGAKGTYVLASKFGSLAILLAMRQSRVFGQRRGVRCVRSADADHGDARQGSRRISNRYRQSGEQSYRRDPTRID